MTDIWDFSNLLRSWSQNSTRAEKEDREFPEVQSQLNSELSKLKNDYEIFKNPSSLDGRATNFLTTPLPPLSKEAENENKEEKQAPEKEENVNEKENDKEEIKIGNINELSPIKKIDNKPLLTPLNTRKIESALDKRPKPISQLSRPMTSNKIVKPKEFQLKSTRQYKQKVVQKFDQFFRADPPELKVVNFTLKTEYIMTFTIQNVTHSTRGFQLRGPNDKAFSYKILEDVENSLIRPGLHLTVEVVFYPEEPRDYESEFLFIPGPNDPITKVPIKCFRDPPNLKVPDIVDLNAALVFSKNKGSFSIKNIGGIATFSFHSNNGKEKDGAYIDGPFMIQPYSFELGHNDSIDISITFAPLKPGNNKVSFEIVPQFFPQRFYFISQGVSSNPDLKFEICEEDKLFVPFLPKDSGTTKVVEIVNDTNVGYPYHIQCIPLTLDNKSELFSLYPEHRMVAYESDNSPFIIAPLSGHVKAKEKIGIFIKFDPIMFSSYSARLLIFADKIPDSTGKTSSVKMLTVNIEASTGSTAVVIQPPLVIYNSIIPKTNFMKKIEVLNKSNLDIKLQWRKSELISPNPIIFEVKPNEKANVELNCILVKKGVSREKELKFFKYQPELEMQAKKSITWHISSPTKYKPQPEINIPKVPISKLYAISFKESDNDVQTSDLDELTINDNVLGSNSLLSNEINLSDQSGLDNILSTTPNLLNVINSRELKKTTSFIFKKSIGVMPSIINKAFFKQSPIGHLTDEISFSMNNFNDLTFTYSASIKPPLLTIKPPILEFGSVLTGKTEKKKITLINPTECPIGYVVQFPNKPEWKVNKPKDFVIEKRDVFVSLHFDDPVSINDLITITTFWCDEEGRKIDSLPDAVFDVPVIAVFDRPIINIKERIIDIGEIFPTLEYQASTEISLQNIFSTSFQFIDASYSVDLTLPVDQTEIKYKATPYKGKIPDNYEKEENLLQCTENSSEEISSLQLKESSNTNTNSSIKNKEIRKTNSTIIDILVQNDNTVVYEYTKTTPKSGTLHPLNGKTVQINIIACFCRLGENALPFICDVAGKLYRCAIVAHVQPPKITLLTETIDFSEDFVICKTSHSFVKVKNECGIASTVQIKMIDNCNDVFSLDNDNVFPVVPFGSAEIPVSCYSEIHGDYNGLLRLIIRDPWQYKEIDISMHVKALGSFYGFKKHTLGYTPDVDGDFVSFGEDIHLSQTPKVIRRLTLVNFSSESIHVYWSISNFVKGRKYANVLLDLDEEGKVLLDIQESTDANIQSPYRLLTSESIIESQGKTVVVVEFTPKEPGIYRGCVAARSGEFIHTLGLYAHVFE